MSYFETNQVHPIEEDGDPTLSPIKGLIETMGGVPADTAVEPVFFETTDGEVKSVGSRILDIIAHIEETTATTAASAIETQAIPVSGGLRPLQDYDIIDLDAIPDSPNALYVATLDDLRYVLGEAYDVLGFTDDFFTQFGILRENFLAKIIAHEGEHAKYARRIGVSDIRYSVLIKPAQNLDELGVNGDAATEFAGYEAVVQTDLGGQISKLGYAAVVLGAQEPTAEDRSNIRHVFGYSGVREAIARMKQHNHAGREPYLPLPSWCED